MKNDLSQVKIFMDHMVSLEEAAWQVMAERLVFRTCKKREPFVKQGRICDEVAFVVKGATRFYYTVDGEEITTFFTFENSWISSYKSFITRLPSKITVEAMEDSELFVLSYDDLHYLYNHFHSAERFGRLIAEYLYTCIDDRSFSLLLKTPEERYLNTLQDNSIYFERVPQHYIASYLGIKPESLSRIRKRVMQRSFS